MGKLIKYEFRKTTLSKLIILLFAAAAELLFLIGLFADWENGFFWGIFLLMACAMFGIFYIGIESILVLSRDLNTKQSYMLFMVPRNSFQILGAKALENLITIAAAGAFFLLIAVIDISLSGIYLDGLNEFMTDMNRILNMFFGNLPTWYEALAFAAEFLLSWFLTITVGYLAVILSCTVLAGKRLSGLISFVLFILFSWLVGTITDYLPELSNLTLNSLLNAGVILLFVVLFNLLSGWILEKKLSV